MPNWLIGVLLIALLFSGTKFADYRIKKFEIPWWLCVLIGFTISLLGLFYYNDEGIIFFGCAFLVVAKILERLEEGKWKPLQIQNEHIEDWSHFYKFIQTNPEHALTKLVNKHAQELKCQDCINAPNSFVLNAQQKEHLVKLLNSLKDDLKLYPRISSSLRGKNYDSLKKVEELQWKGILDKTGNPHEGVLKQNAEYLDELKYFNSKLLMDILFNEP